MQMLVAVLVAAGASMEPDAITFEVHRLWATGAYTDVQVEQAGSDLGFRAVPKQRPYLRRVEFDPPGEKRGLRLEPGTPIDAVAATRIAAARLACVGRAAVGSPETAPAPCTGCAPHPPLRRISSSAPGCCSSTDDVGQNRRGGLLALPGRSVAPADRFGLGGRERGCRLRRDLLVLG